MTFFYPPPRGFVKAPAPAGGWPLFLFYLEDKIG